MCTRIQHGADARIASVKISDFSTKTNKPKQPVIEVASKIKHAPIEEAIGRRLTV